MESNSSSGIENLICSGNYKITPDLVKQTKSTNECNTSSDSVREITSDGYNCISSDIPVRKSSNSADNTISESDHQMPSSNDQMSSCSDQQISCNWEGHLSSDSDCSMTSACDSSISTNSDCPITSGGNHPVSSDSDHPVSSDSDHPVSSDSDHPVSSDSDHPVSSDRDHPVSSDREMLVPSNCFIPISSDNPPQILSVQGHLSTDYHQISPCCNKQIFSENDTQLPSKIENELSSKSDNRMPSHVDESNFQQASTSFDRKTKTNFPFTTLNSSPVGIDAIPPSTFSLKDFYDTYLNLRKHFLVLIRAFDNLGTIAIHDQDSYIVNARPNSLREMAGLIFVKMGRMEREMREDIKRIRNTLKECYDNYNALVHVSTISQISQETDRGRELLRVLKQDLISVKCLLHRCLQEIHELLEFRDKFFC